MVSFADTSVTYTVHSPSDHWSDIAESASFTIVYLGILLMIVIIAVVAIRAEQRKQTIDDERRIAEENAEQAASYVMLAQQHHASLELLAACPHLATSEVVAKIVQS